MILLPTSSTAETQGGVFNDDDERLEGDGQEFYTLAPTSLTFRSTAPLSELQEVQVNGVTVDPSNYTTEEGSTIVTLSIDYLKTLGVDNYEITVVSDSKSVNGGFSVVAPELNEHGFYYNQPYTAYVEYFGGKTVFFIRDDGTMDVIILDMLYTETCSYTMSGNTITVNAAAGTFTGTVSADNIYCNELYTAFVLGDMSIASDADYIYTYESDLGGYGVTAIDKTKAAYGAIKTGINGYPTVMLCSEIFINNDSLVVAPEIPNSVTSIGESAFAGCRKLTSITIPDSVTNIGRNAFFGCSSLYGVIIPDCVLTIGTQAFNGCESLDTIVIPRGVETIENSVFGGCANLISVSIGDGVRTIGNSAFAGCKKLSSVVVPENVDSIEMSAFENCHGLKSIVIPDNATNIGQAAFRNCAGLESVIIGNGISVVDQWTFYGCSSLTSVVIGNRVTTIGDSAFSGCSSLTSVNIPDSVTTIGRFAFADCKSAKNIIIGNGVTSIEENAFVGCSNLEDIALPSSVTSIGGWAFNKAGENNGLITSITFAGTMEQWSFVELAENWNVVYFNSNENIKVLITEVICSDGTVAL